MTEPISPKEARRGKRQGFPSEILDAFNKLLKEKYSSSITIYQNEVLDLALENFSKAGKEVTRDEIFEKGWLDVESYFRKAGWEVDYDKPAYCESYEAFFTFSPGKKKRR